MICKLILEYISFELNLFKKYTFPQVVFPEANFLPVNKLKQLEQYFPSTQEKSDPDSMDDDLYIYADLEDCDLSHERHRLHYIEEDFHPGGGVQCQTS